jgi:hypothetical protein
LAINRRRGVSRMIRWDTSKSLEVRNTIRSRDRHREPAAGRPYLVSPGSMTCGFHQSLPVDEGRTDSLLENRTYLLILNCETVPNFVEK